MGLWPEKRGAPRYRVRLSVRFWNDHIEGRAYTTDLSETGLLLEDVPSVVTTHQRLHLEVRLPEGPFFAEAKVARIIESDGGLRSAALRLLTLFDVLPGAGATRGRI